MGVMMICKLARALLCLGGMIAPHVAMAGGQSQVTVPDPIVVLCPESLPTAVCEGMQSSLLALNGPRAVVLRTSAEAACVSVQFIPINHTDHVLAGHLEWHTPKGVVTGPRMDLSVMDGTLQPDMLQQLGRQLIATSPNPF